MSTDELVIAQEFVQDMVDHCAADAPNEACGLLAGKAGVITKVLRMTNAAASPMRYALDPKEQFEAYDRIEREGLELGGVFHSHTRTAAYPSPTDVRMATEDVPYVIVSLATQPPEVRAFRIVKEAWDSSEGDIVEVTVRVEG